ncbi:MAG: hypothetical protein AAI902_00115 [Candidatus Hodgkinia cicadicola]
MALLNCFVCALAATTFNTSASLTLVSFCSMSFSDIALFSLSDHTTRFRPKASFLALIRSCNLFSILICTRADILVWGL